MLGNNWILKPKLNYLWYHYIKCPSLFQKEIKATTKLKRKMQ